MPMDHDPPLKKDLSIHLKPHRSFEWWETIDNTSYQPDPGEDIYNMPYED